MKKCTGCRYWSEIFAQGNADNTAVEAMCLNEKSEHYGKYKVFRCDEYDPGLPIDLPT